MGSIWIIKVRDGFNRYDLDLNRGPIWPKMGERLV